MNPSVQIRLDVTRFPFRSCPGTSRMSSHLTLVTSDRPALLIERLALDLGRAPLSPFTGETIVVQSMGMERWVANELALRHGCAASLRFPFPAAFCHELARNLDEGDGTASLDPRFERDALTWRILQLLEREKSVVPSPAKVAPS